MALIPYTKPARTYQEQLELLKDRGLKIKSDPKALHLLEKLSYYRLSGYWHPLLAVPKEDHIFLPDASLQTAFDLYRFDRDFRIFILKELEKIEVAIRSHMIYEMSHSKGAFWIDDVNNFSTPADHSGSIGKLNVDYRNSDDEFIKAFRRKYSNPLPPSWMLLEISSFGCVSKIYENLRPNRSKRDIANAFGLDETTLASWLHSFAYVRNVCAHHSRLWNRKMKVRPRIPLNPTNTWLNNTQISNSRTYFILCMMLYLLQTIDQRHQFIFRIHLLLRKYKIVDVKAMGFPDDWQSEPLWKFKPTFKQWVRLNVVFKMR